MHSSRRDFLRMLSIAVGASLSGCGGNSDSLSGVGVTPGVSGPIPASAPLAYRFVPLVGSGQSLSGGIVAKDGGGAPFMGGVMINDQRQVYFHADDQAELLGVYRVDVSKAGGLSDCKKVLRENDVLPDGTVVDWFSPGDINNQGQCLVTVTNPEGVTTLQYAEQDGLFRPLAKAFQQVSPQCNLSGEVCETQSLADDGRILFVADYYDDEGKARGEGVFLLQADRPAECQLVIANDQLVPGTTCGIKTFGVSELRGDRYLVQGSAKPLEGEDSLYTYLLTGRLGETPQLLAGDPGLAGSGSYLPGEVKMCARLGAQSVGSILQTSEDATQLRVNQQLLLEANFAGGGSRSPRGSAILSLFPPVFGPSGVVYFEAFTNDGMELIRYDGSGFSTILAKGDTVNGKVVETILFGCLPKSCNAQGDLVFVAEFSDGESAVLLGIPV